MARDRARDGARASLCEARASLRRDRARDGARASLRGSCD